jgi:phospholipase B1
MRKVVAKLERLVPRLVLNIHQQFNVSQIYDVTKDEPYCKKIRSLGLVVECLCAFQNTASAEATRNQMDVLAQEYNNRLFKIRNDYMKRQGDDFLLIVDPLFKNAALDQFPISYISNVDCFHPVKLCRLTLGSESSRVDGNWFVE